MNIMNTKKTDKEQQGNRKINRFDFITRQVENIIPDIIHLRRDFHRYPEIGWTEYRTTALIGRYLEKLGWKVHIGKEAVESSARLGVPSDSYLKKCENRALEEGVTQTEIVQMAGGHTGLVAEWHTGIPGPITAFRFDIDGLDVEESSETDHFPYEQGFHSLYAGCMHACGHDGHIAIGLGLARMISDQAEALKLSGTVRLLFQPAEEGCRGAISMVEKGWLNDVDYLLGGHIAFRSFELGEVVLNTNQFLATTKWDAVFSGKGAHAGGEPEMGKNALLAAANAVVNLHAISRHSQGSSRINVGKLEGGTGRNIIPSKAILEFETRGETDTINNYISEEAFRILKGSASMYDVGLELIKVGEACGVVGNAEWICSLTPQLKDSKVIKNIQDELPLGASEDVVHMMKRVQENGGKSAYLLFGSPVPARHHQPAFNFDEKVLQVGVEVYIRILASLNK